MSQLHLLMHSFTSWPLLGAARHMGFIQCAELLKVTKGASLNVTKGASLASAIAKALTFIIAPVDVSSPCAR